MRWLLTALSAALVVGAAFAGMGATVLAVHCPRSVGCEVEGTCGWSMREMRCVATPEGCRASEACVEDGACSVDRGRWCAPTTVEDCKGPCDREGRCGLGDRTCAGSVPVGCERSALCAEEGRCQWSGGACHAVTDGDCARSVACTEEGRCRASKGWCVAGPSAGEPVPAVPCREGTTGAGGPCTVDAKRCAAWLGCRHHGLCSVVTGSVGRRGGDPHDAKSLPTCAVAADDDCRRAAICTAHGRCTAVEGRCRATRDADCRASAGCETRGECVARDGACVVSCADQPTCREEGRCVAQGSACVATEEHCRASLGCAQEGLCTAVDGVCRAEPGDCRGAAVCAERGRCAADEGACRPGSEDDCRASAACREEGYCSFVEGAGCALVEDEDCRRSALCRRFGRCARGAYLCEARAEKDCARSAACAALGHCTLRKGRCVAE